MLDLKGMRVRESEERAHEHASEVSFSLHLALLFSHLHKALICFIPNFLRVLVGVNLDANTLSKNEACWPLIDFIESAHSRSACAAKV
jgi:hypothetical protein